MASRFQALRVQAALAGQVLKLTSATFNDAGGNLSASGNYDFNADASRGTRAAKTSTSRASISSAAVISMLPASLHFPFPAPARRMIRAAICIWMAMPR